MNAATRVVPLQTDYCTLIDALVARGGPGLEDYPTLDAWAAWVFAAMQSGDITRDQFGAIRSRFGNAFSAGTLTDAAMTKSHGYAGDFEIIDRIYREATTDVPHAREWDLYWQSCGAPNAVRNRKAYFHRLLELHARRRSPLRVLNVASGPGRCMFEWLQANPAHPAHFHCVEMDPQAIKYASELNRAFLDRITFTRRNALKFTPVEQYDLVWSAGLFDYFDDETFVGCLRRLLPAIAPGGELVIGNFSPSNPTRCWMELSEWPLHYRNRGQLEALALACGIPASRVRVGQEPCGVNLFLHVSHAAEENRDAF